MIWKACQGPVSSSHAILESFGTLSFDQDLGPSGHRPLTQTVELELRGHHEEDKWQLKPQPTSRSNHWESCP